MIASLFDISTTDAVQAGRLSRQIINIKDRAAHYYYS
jgi:hypothetical protein